MLPFIMRSRPTPRFPCRRRASSRTKPQLHHFGSDGGFAQPDDTHVSPGCTLPHIVEEDTNVAAQASPPLSVKPMRLPPMPPQDELFVVQVPDPPLQISQASVASVTETLRHLDILHHFVLPDGQLSGRSQQ